MLSVIAIKDKSQNTIHDKYQNVTCSGSGVAEEDYYNKGI
jgi:hypothetical protein